MLFLTSAVAATAVLGFVLAAPSAVRAATFVVNEDDAWDELPMLLEFLATDSNYATTHVEAPPPEGLLRNLSMPLWDLEAIDKESLQEAFARFMKQMKALHEENLTKQAAAKEKWKKSKQELVALWTSAAAAAEERRKRAQETRALNQEVAKQQWQAFWAWLKELLKILTPPFPEKTEIQTQIPENPESQETPKTPESPETSVTPVIPLTPETPDTPLTPATPADPSEPSPADFLEQLLQQAEDALAALQPPQITIHGTGEAEVSEETPVNARKEIDDQPDVEFREENHDLEQNTAEYTAEPQAVEVLAAAMDASLLSEEIENEQPINTPENAVGVSVRMPPKVDQTATLATEASETAERISKTTAALIVALEKATKAQGFLRNETLKKKQQALDRLRNMNAAFLASKYEVESLIGALDAQQRWQQAERQPGWEGRVDELIQQKRKVLQHWIIRCKVQQIIILEIIEFSGIRPEDLDY